MVSKKCLLNDYVKKQDSGALPSALYIWSLSFTTAMQGRFDCPYLADEETETHRA